MAVFGPKLQFLKLRSATCEPRSRPPPLSFLLKLCVIVLHTHRYHPPTFHPSLKHHDGVLIFSHFARAACLLAAAAAKPGRGQNSPRTHSKRPNKGKVWVHSMCGLTFPCQRALCGPLTPPYVPETAQKGPQKPQILCRLAGESHKPRAGHIFGYMAENAIPRAPSPPATPHFLWFPRLKNAQMDA